MKKEIRDSHNKNNHLTSTEVWDEFSADLKRYIFKLVQEEDNTNDILQEVFIKIHLNIDSLQKKESIKSWLFTIAHNTVMSFFNKNSKVKSDFIFIEETTSETEIHSPQNCLIPLINHLPEKYREPMMLSEIYGKKQTEVAKMLAISHTAAKSRIQRGRKLLQQGFIDCCHYKLNEKGLLVGEHLSKEDCKVCN